MINELLSFCVDDPEGISGKHLLIEIQRKWVAVWWILGGCLASIACAFLMASQHTPLGVVISVSMIAVFVFVPLLWIMCGHWSDEAVYSKWVEKSRIQVSEFQTKLRAHEFRLRNCATTILWRNNFESSTSMFSIDFHDGPYIYTVYLQKRPCWYTFRTTYITFPSAECHFVHEGKSHIRIDLKPDAALCSRTAPDIRSGHYISENSPF